MKYWHVQPEWAGQPAFIVGGGTSVASLDLGLIRGERTIVINSSYGILPDADFLFFADVRWWQVHCDRIRQEFHGRVATCSQHAIGSELLRLKKIKPPPGLADKPTQVVVQRTSTQAAINLAVHLGANPIVLLGIDNGPDESGNTHHHEPHQWAQKPGKWKAQRDQLALMVEPLEKRGITVLNANPKSNLDLWPRMVFPEAVATARDMVTKGRAA